MADSKVHKTMSWFVAGAFVGAVVAILYAPQTGVKTRKMIRAKSEDSYKFVSDKTKDLTEKGQDMYHRGVEWADDAKKSVTARVKELAA